MEQKSQSKCAASLLLNYLLVCRGIRWTFLANWIIQVLRSLLLLNLISLQLCITKLVSYDAQTLKIMLKYMGLSLVKFVDRQLILQLLKNSQYQILLDVSSGLDYIYTKNVIYRDLILQNILYNKTIAKIYNFRLSRKDGNLINYNRGIPCYILEKYLYKGLQGAPTDIQAFKVIILFISSLIPILQGKQLIISIFLDPRVQLKIVNWLSKVDKVIGKILERLSLVRQMLTSNLKN